MSIIERNIADICRLCEKHHVGRMAVFGSVLTNRFRDDSDIDLLVDFNAMNPEEYADNYLMLSLALRDLLGREVDLVEEKAIRNPIFLQNVERTKVQIYG